MFKKIPFQTSGLIMVTIALGSYFIYTNYFKNSLPVPVENPSPNLETSSVQQNTAPSGQNKMPGATTALSQSQDLADTVQMPKKSDIPENTTIPNKPLPPPTAESTKPKIVHTVQEKQAFIEKKFEDLFLKRKIFTEKSEDIVHELNNMGINAAINDHTNPYTGGVRTLVAQAESVGLYSLKMTYFFAVNGNAPPEPEFSNANAELDGNAFSSLGQNWPQTYAHFFQPQSNGTAYTMFELMQENSSFILSLSKTSQNHIMLYFDNDQG